MYSNQHKYFVLSINTRTNSGKIVGHADDLESAITAVTRCAREYVLAKSEPLLHRKVDVSGEENNTKIHFFSSNSNSNIHQIDVFKQQTDILKGWLGNITQKPHCAELIRRFMYCAYPNGGTATVVPIIPQAPPVPVCVPVKKTTANKKLPTGGFPVDVIDSLICSEQFRRHRHNTDENTKEYQKWSTLENESEE